MKEFWVNFKTKEFWVNFVLYFIILSVVVGIISYFLTNGRSVMGVPPLRIVIAMYFAHRWPVYLK